MTVHRLPALQRTTNRRQLSTYFFVSDRICGISGLLELLELLGLPLLLEMQLTTDSEQRTASSYF